MCNPSCSWGAMVELSWAESIISWSLRSGVIFDFSTTGGTKVGPFFCCQFTALSMLCSSSLLSASSCLRIPVFPWLPSQNLCVSFLLFLSKQLLLKDLRPQVSCQCLALGFLHPSADPPSLPILPGCRWICHLESPPCHLSPLKPSSSPTLLTSHHICRCFLPTPALINVPLP